MIHSPSQDVRYIHQAHQGRLSQFLFIKCAKTNIEVVSLLGMPIIKGMWRRKKKQRPRQNGENPPCENWANAGSAKRGACPSSSWQTSGSGVYNGLLGCLIYWVEWNTRNARPAKKSRDDNNPATGRSVKPVQSISSKTRTRNINTKVQGDAEDCKSFNAHNFFSSNLLKSSKHLPAAEYYRHDSHNCR